MVGNGRGPGRLRLALELRVRPCFSGKRLPIRAGASGSILASDFFTYTFKASSSSSPAKNIFIPYSSPAAARSSFRAIWPTPRLQGTGLWRSSIKSHTSGLVANNPSSPSPVSKQSSRRRFSSDASPRSQVDEDDAQLDLDCGRDAGDHDFLSTGDSHSTVLNGHWAGREYRTNRTTKDASEASDKIPSDLVGDETEPAITANAGESYGDTLLHADPTTTSRDNDAPAITASSPTSQPVSPRHPTVLRLATSAPRVLRPYQAQVLQACLDALERGVRRFGVSSPTGSGKTVMFTHLIPLLLEQSGRSSDAQSLILVGNIELARQAHRTLVKAYPNLSVELEQGAKHRASGQAQVTIATYQSISQTKRLAKYDPSRFVAVIVDEAHHAVAPSYLKLLSYFNSDIDAGKDDALPSRTPAQAPIIGFTATFSRHDQLALSAVFEEIVYHRDVWDMLQEGWLAQALFTTVKADLRLAEAKINDATGDFSLPSLAKLVNTSAVNELVVRTYLDRAVRESRKSTLVFCVDLNHVVELTDTFRRAGIDARWISSKSSHTVRQETVAAFKAGEFPVLINCEILTEGTDIPNIDCIIIARPTRSRNLFSQMIGRGLRHSPGKSDCRIIDFVDNITKVEGLVSAPTLLGLDLGSQDVEDETVQTLRARASTLAKATPVEIEPEDLDYETKSVTYRDLDDPFQLDSPEANSSRKHASKYCWIACGDGKSVLESMGNGYFSIIRDNSTSTWLVRHAFQNHWSDDQIRRRSAPFGKVAVHGRAESFSQALKIGDKLVERLVPRNLLPQLYRFAPWRMRPATEAQRALMEKMGLRNTNEENDAKQLTAGRVAAMLTAAKHGAKTRRDNAVRKADRAKEKADQIKRKEEERVAKQMVRVGKL